jgi:iron complex outermembrane receptor protein
VSGSTNLRQGPNQNTVDGKYIQNNSYSGRAHLWEPTSKLTANFIADYTYFTQSNEGDFFTLSLHGFQHGCRLGKLRRHCGRGQPEILRRQPHAKQQFRCFGPVRSDAGPFTLTSISAYRGTRHSDTGQNIVRADPTALTILDPPGHNRLTCKSGTADRLARRIH